MRARGGYLRAAFETGIRYVEDTFPLWKLREPFGWAKGLWRSELVTIEELVFVAAGAVRALQAADKENGHSQCNQDGEHARVRFDPMK